MEENKYEKNVTIYIKENVHLQQYEPCTGVYLGADVNKDPNIKGDIRKFDNLTGTGNIFRVFQYDHEERLQGKDILRCIATKKIPYIKVYLQSTDDLTPIYRLAMDLKSTYQIPVFIELFPVSEHMNNPEAYKKAYENGYKVIHDYIKQAVVVWSISDSKAYECMLYYPGDKLADWVGMNIYIPRYKFGETYLYEGEKEIDFFYKNFQARKPVLISGLAISHYSRVDHTYTIYDTKQKLDYFYNKVLKGYPRIKGILYVDMDMSVVRANGKEDYTLTGQPDLTEEMQKLAKELNVLTMLEEEVSDKNEIYMRYDIEGTFFKNQLYIPADCMKTLFRKVPLSKLTPIENLNGERFYAFRDITTYYKCYYQK
ncbi:glycosyl hydrolase [Cellulosilyticum ruminicola]|uniref:glycosyl hydrolase n=1 Tax=Cellulosilyticum ruminicola TaxID=425254 RepID=UPI0006D2BF7C|nr:glycosyl hydrolase [Cellulosilyticum ruminicola]